MQMGMDSQDSCMLQKAGLILEQHMHLVIVSYDAHSGKHIYKHDTSHSMRALAREWVCVDDTDAMFGSVWNLRNQPHMRRC